MKFVRDQYPQARFQRIYDAETDGWDAQDFHTCSDKKGWTLTLVETTENFIFGGFTTAEWESSPGTAGISKPSPQSFLFSVNEGTKYPITGGDRESIVCYSGRCAVFGKGGWELQISTYSNIHNDNFC